MDRKKAQQMLSDVYRPVPMPVGDAARIVEKGFRKALGDVRHYARQLERLPEDVAEENDKTAAQDRDLASKRVHFRQAGLFEIRHRYLDLEKRIENLKARRKAEKKLSQRFGLTQQIGQISRERDKLRKILADPFGYINQLHQLARQSTAKANALQREVLQLRKKAGAKKKSLLDFKTIDKLKLRQKEQEAARMAAEARRLNSLIVDPKSPQFKAKLAAEINGLKTRRAEQRRSRINLTKWVEQARAAMGPRLKALELVWRMERYGYDFVMVPLIKKRDPEAVSAAVLKAVELSSDPHSPAQKEKAAPEELLARFNASYRQAEVAAEWAPELLDEIEKDMRVLEKALKRTDMGKRLLKKDKQDTHKDYGYRMKKRKSNLVHTIHDFLRGHGRKKRKDNLPKL